MFNTVDFFVLQSSTQKTHKNITGEIKYNKLFFPHPVPVAPDRERHARCVLADELGLGAGGLATQPLVRAVRTIPNAVAPAII